MKYIQAILFLFFGVIVFAAIKNRQIDKDSPLNYPQGSTYSKEWIKVDSLIENGLYKSALDIVKTICSSAKKQSNSPQFVKAILYKTKLISFLEENSHVTSIKEIEGEIKLAEHPIKPILHSILAEMYWMYYENNRWLFYNRTTTSTTFNEDINTWDANKILMKVLQNHQQALAETEKLKRTPLNVYDEIILNKDQNTRTLRPTLFDFIAHRALDFYTNEESSTTQPNFSFSINDNSYFDDARTFSNKKITTVDTTSLKYQSLLLFQGLIQLHLNDKDPAALLDIDLKRLSFVNSNASLVIRDSLYYKALTDLEKKHSQTALSADVSYELANIHFKKGNAYIANNSDENKWEKQKAYEIAERAATAFPESHGGKNCKNLLDQIKQKSISLTTEQVNLPSKPFKALVKYKNINKLFIRVCKLDEKEIKNESSYSFYDERKVKQYTQLQPEKSWSVDLPDDKDFQEHSVEIKIPELKVGTYIVLCSPRENFSLEENAIAYNKCTVSNMAYVSRQNAGNGDVYILDRQSGRGIKNATVQLWYNKYEPSIRANQYSEEGKYTTNDDGYVNIPATTAYQYYDVEIKTNDDYLFVQSALNTYQKSPQYPTIKTFLFTDRAIYRPGQTVYFKGIVLQTDGEKSDIQKNHTVEVSLYDANYQKVSTLNLTTNQFGSVSGSFVAPSNGLNGQMQLRSSDHAHCFFSVEEYKRPKFIAKINPIKGSYRLNEDVSVDGTAMAYNGAKIDGAEVKYRVVRETSFPFMDYYFRSRFYPQAKAMEIANGYTTTNDTGGFFLSFKAIPDLEIDVKHIPVFSYQIFVDITDINGETRSTQTSVAVGKKSLLLDVVVPQNINKNTPQKITINTSNLNGQPEPSKGTIEIVQLKAPNKIYKNKMWERSDKYILSKEEHNQFFPEDEYEKESDIETWPVLKTLGTYSFDTKKSKELELPNTQWNSGQYLLKATTKDKYGEEVVSTNYFSVYSEKEKKLAVPQPSLFIDIKTKGEPGEKALYLIGSQYENVVLLYEIENKEKIVEANKIVLNKEQKLIEVPIKEEYRGNASVHFTFIKNNRSYQHDVVLEVPRTDKELDIEFETFRDKLLPGQQEEWKIKIKGKRGELLAAEMMATLYDASLDAFRANNWFFDIYERHYTQLSWNTSKTFTATTSTIYQKDWNSFSEFQYRQYEQLNWFGFYYSNYGRYASVYGVEQESYDGIRNKMPMMAMATAPMEGDAMKKELNEVVVKDKSISAPSKKENEDATTASTRKNFNETAFFFPQLQTNEKGEIIIKYTIPEALTKWKMMGLAHTKDLKYGQTTKELVTQKELMVVPNAPRFFREGDNINFTAKISNLTNKDLSGVAELEFFDAITMKPVLLYNSSVSKSIPFSASKEKSCMVDWSLSIPEGLGAITYKITAKSNQHSDGEEMVVPVLTNRMLVTESLPLPINGKQTKAFTFNKFLSQNNGSKTLRNHNLTLEFTSNPAWYAIQALPYLMEYPYECSEQTFSRFYANSLASHIANSNPKTKAVFDSWKTQTPEALLSNLEKNQELKSLLLQETPWVLNAQNESERKKRMALLFDLNKMADELSRAWIKLEKMQLNNGAWPWFEGMQESRYITQHIVAGMGHLEHLGIKKEASKTNKTLLDALAYLDNTIANDYQAWMTQYKKDKTKTLFISPEQIHYLYARGYYKDIEIKKENQAAIKFFKELAAKQWTKQGKHLQGLIALALYRDGNKKIAEAILKSLKETAITSEEMGVYWKDSYEGYFWYESSIELHALMIEVFDEIGNDSNMVEGLKTWLLKSKQTQDWKTTKATADACYALLLKGTDFLASDELVDITLGTKKIEPNKTEAGTGYFKTSFVGTDIKSEMGNVIINKKTDGVAWGSLYWQYFEQLDKITPHATPLKINKKLFLENNTAAGPVISEITEQTPLKPGSKIKVRMELRVDRDMEYVHMKDMRASCFEPINVFSGARYQGGLWYYESTKDASTNFFFSYLSKGTYVFEYPLVVTHYGNFSNGITSIQCMYAPEFTSHSEGIRVSVKK